MPPGRTRRLDNFDDWFWKRVEKTDSCWDFTGGSVGKQGHRIVRMDGRTLGAHVASWIRANGPLPEGAWILHECNRGQCVNPEHLRPGKVKENVADMLKAGNHVNSRKTHCKRGHEFTEENTYTPPKRPGTRQCRICQRIRNSGKNEYQQERRARIRAEGRNPYLPLNGQD